MKSEFKFGEGKISGYLSIFLSALSLGGVICFHFPEYFTTPELRNVYPVDTLRTILAACIGLAFIFGIISSILSQNKKPAFIGLALSLLSVILGGSQVPTPETVNSQYYLGLDWFVLDMLIVAMIFIPIEKVFSRLSQNIFRPQWKTDFYYFFVSHLLIQITSYLILLPSLFIGAKIANPILREWVIAQPLILQFIEILILADLTQYWIHRAFHKIPFLWRFHAIHHSTQYMDWLAGSRLHLVDIVVTRGLTLLPLFILGFDQKALHAYLIFVAFWATFLHVNIRFQFPMLQKFFATPIFHHWHHAIEKEAIDKNFAIHLPHIDKIFGSYYLPKEKWPTGYGIHNNELPESYIAQTLYPFKKK